MTRELEQKLLSICNVAADIGVAGPIGYDNGYFSGCGFTNPLEQPVAYTGGVDAINAALVGRIPEGTVICYRGTLSPDDATRTPEQRLLDWIQDSEAVLVPWISGAGRCHQGFAKAVDSISGFSPLEIQGPVIFTGHSKGGACATLAALRYWLAYRKPVECVTFGAPRAGSASFCTAIADSGVSLTRFENSGDLVPHVPLDSRLARYLGLPVQAFDFQSAGNLAWIDPQGEVENPTDLFEEVQVHGSAIVQLAKSLAAGPGFIRQAHSIAMGSGYWRAVHPEVEAWLE